MLQPVLSVIVPVFNTQLYVSQCLDSLLAQTLREIEIICVDNGSSDGSLTILQRYAQQNPNVTVLYHPQGRQGGARNAGMESARGEFIGFVDSDDFVSPAMFEEMYEAGQKRQAEVVVCNFRSYFDKKGYGNFGLPSDLLSGEEWFSIEQRPKLFRNLTVWNKLYSRQLLRRYNLTFPTGVFHEDQFFAIAAFLAARRIASIPESLYYYRKQRPGSVNEHRGPDCMHVFQVMEKVTRFIEVNEVRESERALLDETKTLKYLEVYEASGRAFKRKYFNKMKREFQSIEVATQPRILSSPERRKFLVVQRYGFVIYNLFLSLREMYGRLRTLTLEATARKTSVPAIPRRPER